MKKGRPSLRQVVKENILQTLEETNLPLNIHSLTKKISEKIGRNLSWNTTRKYLQELVEVDKVEALRVMHSKKKEGFGLTLYKLKK